MPRKTSVLAVTALALMAAASFAFAQDTSVAVDPAIESMSVDQLVEARQNAMKQNGGLLRAAMRASGDEAVAAATTMLQNFTNLPALFREGSTASNSKALPLIWENWEDFKARFDEDAKHAAEAVAAAKANDAAAYGAALQAIGQSCSGCHQMYRG
jgi:cytochrome c556